MAKILVKSPITSNGRDVVLGPDGRIRYKETVLEYPAKEIYEKMNRKLPEALRYIITPFDGEGTITAPLPSEGFKPKARRNEKAIL